MAAKHALGPADIKKACLDPASVFDSPETVEQHPELSRHKKIEILRRWELDETNVDVAADEGMPGGDSKLLRRIVLALERLGETSK
jgi:hypothetical protein